MGYVLSSSGSKPTSGSSSANKIPLIHEKNFAMQKSKVMVVLEIIDYNMMDIIAYSPHIPNFVETKEDVSIGVTKRTSPH